MARLFPWGQIRRVLLPGCGLRVGQLCFQPALVFLSQWAAREAMVSCELASDMARAVTARSGALPGEMKALVGQTQMSLQSLPNLGPVQVLGNADGFHSTGRLFLNNTCLPLGLTCDFTYRW